MRRFIPIGVVAIIWLIALAARAEGFAPEEASHHFDEDQAKYIEGIEATLDTTRDELTAVRERVRELEFQLEVKRYSPSKGEGPQDAKSIKDKLRELSDSDARVQASLKKYACDVLNDVERSWKEWDRFTTDQKQAIFEAVAVEALERANKQVSIPQPK